MPDFIPLPFEVVEPDDMIRRAAEHRQEMQRRRTVRDFSDRAVPRGIIEECLVTAGAAPSGAHRQPWHFAAVADPDVKKQIRIAAEKEEAEFYEHRAPEDWLEALSPFGTDKNKPFLEIAPWLIAVFAQKHGEGPDGQRIKNYYVQESVGIACGFLLTALHRAGLATLTHTPSPMGFLRDILGRPEQERAFLLIVAGYPAENAQVPRLERKALAEISSFFMAAKP